MNGSWGGIKGRVLAQSSDRALPLEPLHPSTMELSTYDDEDHRSSMVHLPLRRLRREVRENDEYKLNSNGEPEVRRLDQAPVCKGIFSVILRGTYTPRGSKMSGQDTRHSSYNNSCYVCIKVLRYEVRKRDEQHFLELVQVRVCG